MTGREEFRSDLARWLEALSGQSLTVAVAESLTGGMALAELTSEPGLSDTVVGGVVAYDTGIKGDVLGVDRDLLAAHGPVNPEVAEQMAAGVRTLMGADIGLATTGEAGPTSGSGKPIGLFYVALDWPAGRSVERHQVSGTRQEIRESAVLAVLGLLRVPALG